MTDPITPTLTENKTQVVEHLVELRRRLILCMLALFAMTGLCYVFVDHILAVLIQPLAESMSEAGGSTQRLIYTSLTEAFFTTLKLSFLSALFLTLPFILMQVWKFVAPGLYKREQGAFLPFLIATPILFLMGAMLVYFFVMPLAWKFFLTFQTSAVDTVLPIQLEARIGDYLNLIISLIFAFGLTFQLPVLLMLLARAGFVKAEQLASKRKYALVLAFLIGAVLTPPDVVSQSLLALPILALYEASIFLIRHMEKSRVPNG
mgnify:CR=1 FL=1